MESKIQELTEKLYIEGVEKGEMEAQKLIEEAQNRSNIIIDKAQEEAKEIVQKAMKQAEELKKNTESELKLYADQTVETLRAEVANLLTDKLAQMSVKTAFTQHDFMPKLILQLVSEWHKKEQLTVGLEDSDRLIAFFIANAKEMLDAGLEIEEVNGKKHSFTITPTDGSYKITFGEEEFIAYFKDFLRPQLVDLLF
jgi:V/A-type H+-transporting ATPase subunit E